MTDKRSEEMVISDLMEAIQGWRDRTCGHNWNWHRPAYDSASNALTYLRKAINSAPCDRRWMLEVARANFRDAVVFATT